MPLTAASVHAPHTAAPLGAFRFFFQFYVLFFSISFSLFKNSTILKS
jgi:hypothetical protein